MSGAGTDLVVEIRNRIEEEWSVIRPSVPLEAPNSLEEVDQEGDAWGRWNLLSDGEPYTEAAGDIYPERHFDTVQLEVFAALGTGRLGREIADDWATLWREHPIPGFRFGVTQILEIGRTGDGSAARWKVDALTRVERSYEP